MRIGNGYDVHALKQGRKLILGGVEIPHDCGLDGHSDADVLIHAIMDALLGAAACGDIGGLFPDNDDKYKGISSMLLLEEVEKEITAKGFKIVNTDAVIIAQSPKLAPYIENMRKNIAAALKIEIDNVSVKATTTEKLGFEGRKEGIAAMAVCLID